MRGVMGGWSQLLPVPPPTPPGCEVTPDVDMGAQKFCIRLLVAAPDGMSEVQLRCRDVSGGGQRHGDPPRTPRGSERPLLGYGAVGRG